MSIDPTQRPKAGAPAANQFGVFQVKYVTGPQAEFIRDLIERKDPATATAELRAQVVLFRAGTLNKKHASDVIDALLALPDHRKIQAAAPGAHFKAANQKQTEWCLDLAARRVWDSAADGALIEAIRAGTPVASRDASAFIDKYRNAPWAPKTAPTTRTAGAAKTAFVTEDGMYRTPDGVIYKVQVAVHGSGNLYAKRLVLPETKGENATFEFEKGAINTLRPEWKMTLEEAKVFGAIYGFCVRCGATLTDEVSIAAGIGPICAGRFA